MKEPIVKFVNTADFSSNLILWIKIRCLYKIVDFITKQIFLHMIKYNCIIASIFHAYLSIIRQLLHTTLEEKKPTLMKGDLGYKLLNLAVKQSHVSF